MTQLSTIARSAIAVGIAAMALTGCAAGAAGQDSDDQTMSTDAAAEGPRVAIAYAGGVLVVDGESLEVIDDLPSEDFVRLNSAGDGRHAFVSTSEGFQLLDVHEPELTELVVEAGAAGHVVRHAGKTVLYDDATSDTTIFDTDALADVDGSFPEAKVIEGAEAHHGVSVLLEDGTIVTTVGDENSRSGIRAVGADGTEIAASDQCPSVHGEGTAKDETVVFGCENGALVYHDGEITKLTSPDEYGRIGNAYVTESSELVVMDYKDDPDAEGSLLQNIALIDTEAQTLEKVALPEGISYTWRGVVRAPSGEVLMIGTDGRLHVIDPATGEITDSFAAIEPWEGPAEWQEEHPAIALHDGVVYVTDSANSQIVALDVSTGEELASGELPEVPDEIVVVG
ncbi:zinc metallochaperone AztD [Microbacterium sp.]|uniref:zinc metallochaperone AztD n=1 Tax=Microbacterium sp. TaxID=51671 RepID=UPI002628BF68|nr:zinc metallochaperone AztD [Microbacterium sp.]